MYKKGFETICTAKIIKDKESANTIKVAVFMVFCLYSYRNKLNQNLKKQLRFVRLHSGNNQSATSHSDLNCYIFIV